MEFIMIVVALVAMSLVAIEFSSKAYQKVDKNKYASKFMWKLSYLGFKLMGIKL